MSCLCSQFMAFLRSSQRKSRSNQERITHPRQSFSHLDLAPHLSRGPLTSITGHPMLFLKPGVSAHTGRTPAPVTDARVSFGNCHLCFWIISFLPSVGSSPSMDSMLRFSPLNELELISSSSCQFPFSLCGNASWKGGCTWCLHFCCSHSLLYLLSVGCFYPQPCISCSRKITMISTSINLTVSPEPHPMDRSYTFFPRLPWYRTHPGFLRPSQSLRFIPFSLSTPPPLGDLIPCPAHKYHPRVSSPSGTLSSAHWWTPTFINSFSGTVHIDLAPARCQKLLGIIEMHQKINTISHKQANWTKF